MHTCLLAFISAEKDNDHVDDDGDNDITISTVYTLT